MIQWLHEHGARVSTDIMEYAAANGRLHVVEWMHENGYKCFGYAMYFAVANNRLDMVKWLCQQGIKCSKSVMDKVAMAV